MKKLPVEFKQKWVLALRSGNYRQGQGYLHNSGYYCCLGVAARCAGVSRAEMGDCEFIPKSCVLVPEILWGMSGLPNDLIRMNDKLGWTFNQIADWIEENL